jgi:chemotaxis protein MotA
MADEGPVLEVAPRRAPARARLDLATTGGLALGLGGIIGGLLLEGGHLAEVFSPTALMIVLGGTLGAVMVSTPTPLLRGAFGVLARLFFEKAESPEALIEKIVDYATRARKGGLVSLEQTANNVEDPFLRKALNLAVDGTDMLELRKIMDLEIVMEEHTSEAEAKIFEGAGGYAPTIGIIGAVMGLIQVMKDLADIDKVGRGIATAFVATIYGVALANLFFLPAAGKIKARALRKIQMRELVLEGVLGIVEGANPKLIRVKLEAFTRLGPGKKAPKNRGEPLDVEPGSRRAVRA